MIYFNPRPRKEGDDCPHLGQFVVNLISIHALVKRATVYTNEVIVSLHISIHALVKRATCDVKSATLTDFVFQSTPS